MLFGFRAAGLRFSSTFGAVLCGVFVGRLITPGTSRNDGVQWLAAMVNWSATSCTVVAAIQWLKNLWITCVVKKYWTVSFRLVYHATCIKAVVERYSSLLRSFSSIFMLGSWNFKLMYQAIACGNAGLHCKSSAGPAALHITEHDYGFQFWSSILKQMKAVSCNFNSVCGDWVKIKDNA